MTLLFRDKNFCCCLFTYSIRDRSLFIASEGGGGGRGIFVATTEHLRDPPLKYAEWAWFIDFPRQERIGGGIGLLYKDSLRVSMIRDGIQESLEFCELLQDTACDRLPSTEF